MTSGHHHTLPKGVMQAYGRQGSAGLSLVLQLLRRGQCHLAHVQLAVRACGNSTMRAGILVHGAFLCSASSSFAAVFLVNKQTCLSCHSVTVELLRLSRALQHAHKGITWTHAGHYMDTCNECRKEKACTCTCSL